MTTMNKSITTILALLALCAASAMAVPSGINYQGALTDDQGNPITGTRTMSIKLYDAATDGTLLYSEDIGEVDVSDGVFSFEFGAGGTSNAQESETVAITDGTATSFQKVLSHPVIVVGMGISVTDGTYTWSQSGGASNEDDFGVVYSTDLRRVTVTYLTGAPAAGRTITATYRTPASGISGALAGDSQPWAEITVDGVAQVPRQKVLAVPFARRAGSASDIGGVTAAGLIRGFGDRVSVVPFVAGLPAAGGQVYQAPTDGLILANVTSASDEGAGLDVLIDSSAPPSTSRGSVRFHHFGDSESITVPVKSGEFYKVVISGRLQSATIYYMPIEKWK